MMSTIQIQDTAAALYDGGWRSEDLEQIITEYELDREDAEAICEKLAEYEEREKL